MKGLKQDTQALTLYPRGRRGGLGQRAICTLAGGGGGGPTSGRKNSTQRALHSLDSASSLRPPHSTPLPPVGSDHHGRQASPTGQHCSQHRRLVGAQSWPRRSSAPRKPSSRQRACVARGHVPTGPDSVPAVTRPAPSVGNKHTFQPKPPQGGRAASWEETGNMETGGHRNEANPAELVANRAF